MAYHLAFFARGKAMELREMRVLLEAVQMVSMGPNTTRRQSESPLDGTGRGKMAD
jgi:hypothetical protein